MKKTASMRLQKMREQFSPCMTPPPPHTHTHTHTEANGTITTTDTPNNNGRERRTSLLPNLSYLESLLIIFLMSFHRASKGIYNESM